MRREKHDDLGLALHRLEACLRWAATDWRAEAGSAFCDTGEVLVAELTILMDAVEQHGVALEAYGVEVGDIAAVQRLLARRRVEVAESLRWTADSLLVLEAEEAASPAFGTGRRDFEARALRRAEQADHDELASVGRRWAELVDRRDAADTACIAALYGAAATSDFESASSDIREATTSEQALRRLDGLSVVDLALLFAENPLLAKLIAEASPEAVREWWDSLALLRPLQGDGLSGAQQALLLAVPWLIGNLDGVPPLARIKANASTAAGQVVENQRMIDDIARHPLDDPRARELIAELEQENAYLRGAAAVPPRVQLYTYDRAADRIVEMLGKWPVAGAPERVYTYVPGTSAQMKDFWKTGPGPQDLSGRLMADDGVDSVAFIYKDGRFPGGGDQVFPAERKSLVAALAQANSSPFARESGERLASFRAGLDVGGAAAGSPAPRSVGIGHSWGTANILASELAGARFDHVVSLAGAGVVPEWAGSPGTEYDSFRYDDALGVVQATGIVYRHRNPQYLGEFEQHEYDSFADRAMEWNSPAILRLAALLTNHALIASDGPGNDEVVSDILDELKTLDPL
ncbi:hypothetical protein IFT90_06110 [Frigoribacterium sp. CFBP 8766]|uniref:hypothetical protein n=1 Tax=Frigoribacterium sp. CFBP 8766 TaxID=2775273 RepID=UPI001781DDF9|nr:hypothetical protein [Frigoribacterium sp. CFBP 8766]MBD8584128.1 hypothetical protein [Frigoribacterium sp. CFBP 8766]